MKNKLFVLFLLLLHMLFFACDQTGDDAGTIDYGSGVYIINEGFFMGNNGSISYYNPDNGTLISRLFEKANSRPVGDVIQSFATNGDTTGFIVANGSAKVEMVKLATFETIAEPLTATYPRYFIPVTDEKGYLSNGSMQGYVLIVDLNNLTITDSIAVGYGPESMMAFEDKIFVCNSGGWGRDSTISVIDISNDQVVNTIQVSDIPLDIALDADQNIWVYCKGYATYSWDPPYNLISETDSYLQKADPGTGNILWQGKVGKAGDYAMIPPKLAISSDGLSLYYLRPDGVYMVSVRNPYIEEEPVISGSYYGIEINPTNGDIYLFEANLSGNGMMKIFDATMNLLVTYTVGIMPNGAVFVP